MTRGSRLLFLFAIFCSCFLAVAVPKAALALLIFSDSGAAAADIQGTVDAFRAALGNPNNANNAGPLASGRREINWDGGGSTANSPGGTPFNVFLNTRGGQFTTPGTGFVQAPSSGGTDGGLATFFSNATYGATFSFFSPVRLFVPVDSNVTEGRFFIPGTNGADPASVQGFGAVFTSVDLADTTTIDFFDTKGELITSRTIQVGNLSFLGVLVDSGPPIGRVQITTGTAALGPNDDPDNNVDVVAMDDFIYSEPQPQAIPEPSTLLLLGAGLAVFSLLASRRYRGHKK